ncbi:MAG: FIST N-terminal domain-containing protein [Gammaproteobacteria bacterium]
MIGVAMSRLTDAVGAASRAATDAVRELQGATPAWALAFSGGHHDPATVFGILREVLGDIPVYGGSCVGAITGRELGYSGSEVIVAAFDRQSGTPRPVRIDGLGTDSLAAGRAMGRALADALPGGGNVLLFYDSVSPGPAGGLAIGSRFMDGIYDILPGEQAPTIVGAGLLGDFQLSRSHLFDGRGPARDCALALVLPDEWRLTPVVMHGCRPVSSFIEVTRVDGARILELDHRPATDVLCERLGLDPQGADPVALAFSILLGRKQGDPFAPFREDRYVNRLIIATDFEAGWVQLFEADLQPGDQVQIMARDPDLMFDSVNSGVSELLARGDTSGMLGLYFDCAGRAGVSAGTESDEAKVVQQTVGGRVPLLGVYVGRELAPFLGRTRPLDWTGVFIRVDGGEQSHG